MLSADVETDAEPCSAIANRTVLASLNVPFRTTLILSSQKAPKVNPGKNTLQVIPENRISNRVFTIYGDSAGAESVTPSANPQLPGRFDASSSLD
jgi:hypothetical protein